VKLSGGEKQRIVIARAVIRKPDILILDEATSSLDNISESIVQQAIDEIARDCTTLIIAHRLSTIQNADWIYVLHQGKIVEEGNHTILMQKKGYYEEMYKTGGHKE
jgi:ABC-type multidrug transport system fused ATPase/permease subunit